MTKLVNLCSHDWESVPKWQGRYRCKLCGAVGYRGLMKAGGSKADRGSILPYGCSKRVKLEGERKPCPHPAVSKNDRRAWVCAEHGGEVRAADDDSLLD